MYKAYYLHYKKNIVRREYIKKTVEPLISGEFITDFDREEIKGQEQSYYVYSEKETKIATAQIYKTMLANVYIARNIPIPELTKNIYFTKDDKESFKALLPKELSKTNLSLNLKHREAWKRLADESCEYGLIMEDDIIMKKENENSIQKKITELINTGADYIDLAGGAGLRPGNGWPFKEEELMKGAYKVETKTTRTTCAYLIKKKCAIELLRLRQPILFPIDIQLTYLFQFIEAKVIWPSDELFVHGSEHGFYNVSNER